MSEYSLQQLKAINEYRVKNNLGFVLSDEAVVSIMQKEMKKTGKIYPGFESLSASNKKMLENSPVFSIGLNLDKQKGISIEKTPKSSEKTEPTEVQTSAIDFLKTVTGQANDTVTERDKEAGVLSSTVNLWQETFNKDLAKSTVKNEIKSTQEDIKLLERASRGEAVYDNLFTGETVSTSFEEMFKKRRGVEFNEQAINDCKEKSQQFARVKTVVNMISDIKDEFKAIADNPMSQFNPEQSSAAIVKAFKMSGVAKLEDMNAILKDIETKNKDNPYISKFGQNLRFETNSNGEPVLMRTTSKGEDVPATAPFKVIAEEVGMRLDKSLATALGIKYNENATAEDMSRLTQQSLEKYQKEYETSFSKAFGKKDLKILADNYVNAQQQGVANIEAGLDIASMALMLVPGGAAATSGWLLKGSIALKNSATVGKAVKALGMVDKSKKAVKATQTMQKVQQAASPFVMANLTLRPTELLEQLTSENGMNSQEWEAWGKEVLENSVYMTVGAGVSKLAEQGAAMYKTKALVSTLKKAGKSADEISAMVKANPVKFPKDIVQSFKKIDNLAKALQVSSETALDISSTYFVNQVMDNGDVTKQDWLMSVGFALSGGVLQKQFKHLNTETKVKYIQDAFKEYGVTKEDAVNILKTMDDISAGKLRVKKSNLSEDISAIDLNKPSSQEQVKVSKNKSVEAHLPIETEQQVRNTAKQIHDKAVNIESSIVSTMHKLGLGNESTMTHRAKSEQSIYDKIKNAMLDPKYPASFEDAVDSVRDMVGTRTRMEDFDYKQYPELVELYKTDPQKAIRLAAEMQSEQYVKSVENIILQQANGTSPINAIKISNYMGKDGISYFSDKQVAYLRDLAAKHDIDLDVGSKTTKVRASGYTALQMNFTTKDGATYEWQLRGSKVNEFAECEHVPYDIRENKDVTGGREILKELYSPIENIVKGLSADDFDEYNNYLTAHYEHLRKLELGFESSAPILPLKFDKRLSAENLENLHKVSDELKNGKISQEEALNMYDKLVNKSSTSEKGDVVYEFLHSDKLSSLSDEDRKFYLKNTKLDKYGQVNPNADYDTEVLNKIFRFAEVNPKIDIEDVENIIRGYNTAEIALNEGRKSFDKVMEVYKDSDYEKILNRKPSFAEAEALSLADTPAKAEYLKSKLKVMAENSDKLGNDFYALTRRLELVETDSQIKLIDTVIDKKIKYPYLEQRLFENVKDDYSVETALKIFSKTDDINTAINLASKNKSQAFDKMLNKLLDSGMTVDDIYSNSDRLNNDIQYKFVAENYKPKLGNLLFNLAGYNNLTNDAQADFLTKILKSKDNLDTATALDLTIYVQYIKSQKQTDFVLNWINKLPDMNLSEINENFHLFSLSDIDIDKIAERKLMEYPDFSYENSRGIVELAQMSDEDFKTVSDRNLVKARLYGTYIDGLIGMSDEQWANVEKRNLTRNKNRVLGNISGQNLMDTDIMQLAGLSDAEYDRINDLIYIEARKSKQLSGSVLVDIARYPDDKFDFAKELVLMKNDLDAVRFRSYDIRMLTNLEGEELKRAKEIIAKNGLLRSSEVIELTNMPESDWNNLHVRFEDNIKDLQNSQDVEDIKLLSSLTDDEFERFDKTIFQDKELASQISDYSFPMEAAVSISKLDDKAISNIKKRDILKLSNNENIISLLAKLNDEAFSYFAKAIENPQEAGNINVLAEIADKPDMISKEPLDKRIGCLNMLMQFDEDLKNNLIKSNININDIQSKLAVSLGERRPNVDTPKAQQLKFVTEILANNNSNTEKVLKEYDFTQFGKEGIPLKYSRDDFNKAINEIIESVPESERNLLLNHFGLEQGKAGYDGLLNNKSFENQNVSEKSKIAAEKILQEINKFTLNNEVMLDDKFTKTVLDGLVKGLPEFTSIIGKKQHGTHAYSVDVHTLKVLQTAMNDPLYNTLSDVDKTIVKFAALLHDTGKRGGIIDKGHAALSANYAMSVLDKFEFPDRVKHRIIDIIDNHHWFEAYNTGKATAQDVAVRCRRPEDFKIYEILAKADFASVNDDFHLSLSKTSNAAEFDTFMDNKFKAVEDEMKNLYSKANIVLDTQFVQNGKLFPTQSVKIGNKETQLKVLNLSQLDNEEDLSKYGFAPGVTRDNARFTVHMTAPEFSRMESVYVLLNNPLNQSGWSASLISADDSRTYTGRKFGFIFDTDQANISKAYYENLGSGTQKDIGDFKELLFSDDKKRSYVKDNLIADLKEKGIEISDDEYAQLTKYLMSKKYTNQIKDIKINGKVIKAQDLTASLDKSRDKLFSGDSHSEIISLNPRIKGLVAKVEKLEDCPQEFLEFAQKHNLPIILMKSSGGL